MRTFRCTVPKMVPATLVFINDSEMFPSWESLFWWNIVSLVVNTSPKKDPLGFVLKVRETILMDAGFSKVIGAVCFRTVD